MTPRCGHQWTTEAGAAERARWRNEGITTARHTCIRPPGHPQMHMCACGEIPPRAGPP